MFCSAWLCVRVNRVIRIICFRMWLRHLVLTSPKPAQQHRSSLSSPVLGKNSHENNIPTMARPKRAIGLLVLLVATLLCSVSGYSVNTTVYDTDLEHVSYGPTDNFCASWMNWIFWHSCWTWAQPWNAAVIHNGRQFTTVHRSLNHQLPTLTVQFRGQLYTYL